MWALATALTAQAAEPLLLDDYYRAALRRSEVVAVQQELITQAQERYEQATSALLPNLEGGAAYTRQYSGGDRPL
jgi:outer membrane protein TolC